MKKLVLILIIAVAAASATVNAGLVTEIKTMTDYEEKIINATEPIVIDFFAEWCGPCKRMAPLVERLAKEFEGKVLFFKINTSNLAIYAIVEQFHIRSIPTFVFKKGTTLSQRVGSMSEKELRNNINDLINR